MVVVVFLQQVFKSSFGATPEYERCAWVRCKAKARLVTARDEWRSLLHQVAVLLYEDGCQQCREISDTPEGLMMG